MLEKQHIALSEIWSPLLLYLKSSFHTADITKIKMNWLEYLFTVISWHRTISYRNFIKSVFPAIQRWTDIKLEWMWQFGRMLIYGGPDALCPPLSFICSLSHDLYISASRCTPCYWRIGIFANHFEGLMNYGRIRWFKSFLRGAVLFEDHYLSWKVSDVDYQFNVMLKWATSFNLGAILSKTIGRIFSGPGLYKFRIEEMIQW